MTVSEGCLLIQTDLDLFQLAELCVAPTWWLILGAGVGGMSSFSDQGHTHEDASAPAAGPQPCTQATSCVCVCACVCF